MVPSRTLIMAVGILVLTMGVSIFGLSGVATAGPPDAAIVSFGLDTGGKCQGQGGKDGKPCGDRGHAESAESRDVLVPRTVVISQGGTVAFNMVGSDVHQVVIFGPGTDPADVSLSTKTGYEDCFGGGDRYIDDPDAAAVLGAPLCNDDANVSPTYTFDGEPGKYLVICAFQPHFTNRDMYGWVQVK